VKVLLIHDFGTLNGGAEHMTLTLRDGLRARGHAAEFFSSRARPLPLPIVADHTCFGTMGPARRVTQAANPMAAAALRRTVRRFKPDVIHCRMFLAQLSPMILPVLRSIPSLLHVVNYDLICPLNTKVLPDGSPCRDRQGAACRANGCMGLPGRARAAVQQRLWRRWEDCFNLIVTNSQWVRQRLIGDGQRADLVVWNGVPVTAPRPPLAGPPAVSFVGRLIPKKGVDVLLRAMSRVIEQLPEARLLVVGDGPQRAALEAQAASLGIASNIRFLGHLKREQMEEAVGGAWVQAAPSVWEEPFGLVGAEALMRGTAAVVTDAGGLAEQVVPEEHGLHVPPGDDQALAGALLRLLSDRALAERLGAAGRDHAMRHFAEDRVVERFIELYAGLIAGRSRWVDEPTHAVPAQEALA